MGIARIGALYARFLKVASSFICKDEFHFLASGNDGVGMIVGGKPLVWEGSGDEYFFFDVAQGEHSAVVSGTGPGENISYPIDEKRAVARRR
ncbi:hypothetical protein [Myxococcus stipitatus]|uniref:hypothetical protein n=1 Tax=Myxococcus stipitatus TaxID=83455 RepID=UPI0002DD4F93|nr:hypothetical protein [Myxococcus stipitatus]